MALQRLEVTKDGLTYCIEARSLDGQAGEYLLEEDPDGWLLTECTKGQPNAHLVRLGRRKRWTDALRDALVAICGVLDAQP